MADRRHKAEIQAMVREAYRAVSTPTGAGAVYYTAAQLAEVPAWCRRLVPRRWEHDTARPIAAR